MSLKNALAQQGGNAPATNQPQTIHQMLSSPKMKQQLAMALPKHVTADRLARVALTEIRKTPKLAECHPMTLLGAIMQCAQLGLEPGSGLGHAYLIPFENRQKGIVEVNFIVGYKGMIDLARRSGQIISIESRIVYDADHFELDYGLESKLVHRPALEAENRGKLRFVYAVAKLKDGGVQFEVMSRAEIEKIRAQSKAGKYGPWVDHFDEMARKSVVRKLFKYLPVSIEMQRAVSLDEQIDAGIDQVWDADIQIASGAIDGELVNVETGEVTEQTPEAPKN